MSSRAREPACEALNRHDGLGLSIRHQECQALRRVQRIERQIGAARFHDAQDRHQAVVERSRQRATTTSGPAPSTRK